MKLELINWLSVIIKYIIIIKNFDFFVKIIIIYVRSRQWLRTKSNVDLKGIRTKRYLKHENKFLRAKNRGKR